MKLRVEKLAEDITVYCGDCRDIIPTLDGLDVCVTDPPYGVGLDARPTGTSSKGYVHFERRKSAPLYQDDYDTIKELIQSTMPLILEKCDRALIFSGTKMMWNYPEPASAGAAFTIAGGGRCSWGFQCSQPILYYGKDPHLADGNGARPNSFLINPTTHYDEKIDHPVPKPLNWMKWAIDRASREGEMILDPFMGSGTTGIACIENRRAFIGIEVDPHYFDVACKRITDHLAKGNTVRKALGPVPKAGFFPKMGREKRKRLARRA